MKTSSSRKRLVLLDAHAIIHRAYHALPDFASTKGEPTGALYGLSTMLLKIIQDVKPEYIVACYDLPQPTYRHEVYKEYKAGRKKSDPELVAQMKRSRDIFEGFNIPIYDKPGFEADDMLGTIVEKVKDIDIVIASGDMDTLQLVEGKRVQVYTLKKGIKDTIMYDEDGVMARFGFGPKLLPDYKGLRGDPSDNIIGIKGIGEKTASILIQTFGTIENIYKELKAGEKKDYVKFKEVKITPRIIELLKAGEEEAMFSKMLALIRRDAPIDFTLPKPWKEGIEIPKVEKLFSELEFRALSGRVKSLVTGQPVEKNVGNGDNTGDNMGETTVKLVENVGKGELKIGQIALWLIDSNKTAATAEEIVEFARAKTFADAIRNLEIEIDKRGLEKVYRTIELPLLPIIAQMEEDGILIDVAYLKELSVEYHKNLNALEKKIWEMAKMEFNINSPKQLGEVLFDHMGLTIKNAKKTAGGARSTKESELMKLAEENPIIGNIMEYRELQKLLGTYIDTIPTQVDDKNRLHAKLLQTGTTTGRMSSEEPNVQNIPIKTELGRNIRRAFIAEKGFVLGSFDYSQIELRVAAFLSKDKKLIDIFKGGGDIHTAAAAEVFGVPEANVDKEMRRRAKVINFGIMYGMGVNALRQNLNNGAADGEVTRTEAQEFYNKYFETFSGLATYLDHTKAEALRNGFTETFFGRRRYFEGIKSKLPFIKAMAERMAINAPIQGTEADIIKLAMVHISDFIKKEGLENDVKMLLQVHDELVFELREGVAEEIAPKLKKIMESVVDPKEISGILCKADYSLGKNWGELK